MQPIADIAPSPSAQPNLLQPQGAQLQSRRFSYMELRTRAAALQNNIRAFERQAANASESPVADQAELDRLGGEIARRKEILRKLVTAMSQANSAMAMSANGDVPRTSPVHQPQQQPGPVPSTQEVPQAWTLPQTPRTGPCKGKDAQLLQADDEIEEYSDEDLDEDVVLKRARH